MHFNLGAMQTHLFTNKQINEPKISIPSISLRHLTRKCSMWVSEWVSEWASEWVSERKRERKRQEENNCIWDMMACVSQASRLLITGTFFDWLLRCHLSQFIMVCWGEEKTNSCHLSLGRNHAGKHWIIVNSPSPMWDSTDPNTSTPHWLHYFKKWNAFQRGKNQAVPRHNSAVLNGN